MESAGSAKACAACGGRWLEESTLAEMLGQMTGQPTTPTFWPRNGLRELHCPACTARMVPMSLESVPIDRCPDGHGVWFDAHELQAVLHGTAPPPAEERRRKSDGSLVDGWDIFDLIASIFTLVVIVVR